MRPRLSAWPLALALLFSALLLVPASPAAAADVPGLVPAEVTVDWPTQSITLTWGEPTSPGVGPVTAFEVRLDSGAWTVLSPTTHTYTYTGVSLADHGVAVRARNALGAGPQTFELLEKPVASAPTAVSAEVVSGTVVRLRWAPPADDHGLPVTGYRVRTPSCITCPPDSGWRPLLPAAQRSYEFTGLIAGARATFEVQAMNAAGAGLPANAEATPRGLPTAPTNVKAERSGELLRDVKVSWGVPTDYGGDAAPQVRLDDGAWIAVPAVGAGDPYPLSYTFPQQSPGAHTVAVRYVNSVGTGPEASAQVAELAASTPPRDLFQVIGPWGNVGVGWQPPATPGPGPVRYLWRLDGEPVTSTGLTGVWLSNLAPGSSHLVTVVAVNRTGLESEPATIEFTVPVDGASSPPRDLFQVIAPWGVGVGWQPPATPGPGPTRYLVSLDGQHVTSTWDTGVWLSDLAPGSTHLVTVVAVNRTGLESEPATIEFRVPRDDDASTPPRDLFQAIAPWGDVGVGWQRPATPGPGPTRYLVSLDGQPVTSTGLSGVWLSNLAPGSSHLVTVVAVNRTGLESEPANIEITVPEGGAPSPPSVAAPPAAPRIIDVSPGAVGGKNSARAQWLPPAAAQGAPVTAYRVFA